MSTRWMRVNGALAAALCLIVTGVFSTARAVPVPPAPCPAQGTLYGLQNRVWSTLPGSANPVGLGSTATGVVSPPCGVASTNAGVSPMPGNMPYWGGRVNVHPREYLIYWGWGQPNAWTKLIPNYTCNDVGLSLCDPRVKDNKGNPIRVSCPRVPVTITEGSIRFTLPCDPEGIGKFQADFVHQLGGTTIARIATQYSQLEPLGFNAPPLGPSPATCGPKQPTAPATTGVQTCEHISNDKDLLAGVWVDNTRRGAALLRAAAAGSMSNPPGLTNPMWDFAREVADAANHFHLHGDALHDANLILLTPEGYNPNPAGIAFHDYTIPETAIDQGVPQPTGNNAYYNGATDSDGRPVPWISYTDIPDWYARCCNAKSMGLEGQQARLAPFSVIMGHELEEEATDPAGGYVTGFGTRVKYYGGYIDNNNEEDGDKCAFAGTAGGIGVPFLNPSTVPGGMGMITGNGGEHFAMQAEWSNADNGGLGYCAGVPSSNSPAPIDPFDNYLAPGYPAAVAPSQDGTVGVPLNMAVPRVSGVPTVGQRLTAHTGSWRGRPTAYVHQWVRCNQARRNCFTIDGATGDSYTLTKADVGSTIGFTETAANTNGSALPVLSVASQVVTASR